MKTTTRDFKKSFRAIRRMARNGHVDEALTHVQRMLKNWPDHPRLLVEKSRLIQLSEKGVLTDAKRALKRAIEVDEDSPPAWIELGYYLLAIEDRRVKAEERFDHAIELAARQLMEAITGKAHAILDQADPLPAEKLSAATDLIGLGKILAEQFGNDDSPEIQGLNERIAEFQERTGKPKSGRNGRNGARQEH